MTLITDKSQITKLNLSGQGLYELPDLSEYTNLYYLNCSQNHLVSLKGLPPSIKLIHCANNEITSLDSLPRGVKWLYAKYNSLSSLDNLPGDLDYLNCSNNLISFLDYLPPKLNSLNCSNNTITSLNHLPSCLTVLNCSSNQIEKLDEIPSTIKFLNCTNNTIRLLNFLPPKLEVLQCTNNDIHRLDYLPSTVYNVVCDEHKMIYQFDEYCQFLTYFRTDYTQYVTVSADFVKPRNIHKLNKFKILYFKLKYGWKIEKFYLSRRMNRINRFKEELMMTMWHPRNIPRFADWGEDGFIEDD